MSEVPAKTNKDIDFKHYKSVLDKRAEKMARKKETGNESEILYQIIVTQIGNEEFGIPFEHLSGITKVPPIVRFPGLPDWMKGIANIKGLLIGVVDLAEMFGINSKKCDYLAVVESKDGKLGVLIDEIGEFKLVTADFIAESFREYTRESGHPILAITKDMITILDIDHMARDSIIDIKDDFRNMRFEN